MATSNTTEYSRYPGAQEPRANDPGKFRKGASTRWLTKNYLPRCCGNFSADNEGVHVRIGWLQTFSTGTRMNIFADKGKLRPGGVGFLRPNSRARKPENPIKRLKF